IPSTTSSSVLMDLASSTVTTPSRPTFSIASASKSPIFLSPLAEMAATLAMSSLPLIFLLSRRISSTAASTARSIPRLRLIGFAPAVTFFNPSRKIAWARTVAVVVPSPATSEVLLATSRTMRAPISSFFSASSISLATVTPSLVTTGDPNFFESSTLRPFGPRVTFTVFARMFTPLVIELRASLLKTNCLPAISRFLLNDDEGVFLIPRLTPVKCRFKGCGAENQPPGHEDGKNREGLSFDHTHGTETSHLLTDTGLYYGVYDGMDILVSLGHLFSDGPASGRHEGDAELAHLPEQVASPGLFERLGPALDAPGPVATAAEGFIHGLLGSCQDVRTGSHVARDQHGLTHGLVCRRKVGRMRRKRPGRPFAMHTDRLFFAVDDVTLELGHVVAYIIDQP